MSCRGLLLLVLATAAALLSTASTAAAEFGPIDLVSKSTKEQADLAIDPALSADGNYLAFDGVLGGHEGIFRKDLATGELRLVAEMRVRGQTAPEPSISADGRYVAFATTVELDPVDDVQLGTDDVYVADLATSPPTYELASALDGCDPATSALPCGLTYVEGEGVLVGAGSVAAGRVALSADGREVAFITQIASDLTGAVGAAESPAGEVAVRDLVTDRTTLISVAPGTAEPVPGGGADPRSKGAAISADGSTVAWVGSHLQRQVPMLAEEIARIEALEGHGAGEYHEPLWRRVPSTVEPDPATRRIVGGGDPLAPGCPPAGTLAESACQGPFPDLAKSRERNGLYQEEEGVGWGAEVPQLSSDGGTVATVGAPDEDRDLFVVNMAPSLSRVQAVRRLTRWINPEPGARNPESLFQIPKNYPQLGEVTSCAISPDGTRIAFTTTRQLFPLAPPTLTTPPPSGAGELAELYQVDLTGDTIERVTPGTGGGAISTGKAGGVGASAPSYDGNGQLLAFASTASNLAPGDTNEAADAFVVESPPSAAPGTTVVSPGPARLTLTPLRKLVASATSRPNGRVRVVVGVPDGGEVGVLARSQLGTRLRMHQVASAHKSATAGGSLRFELGLSSGLSKLAHRKGGLYTQIAIDFSGPGGPPLHSSLAARFRVHPKHPHKKRSKR
ncbi:MAG: hypothetical protein ACRDPE_16870 [Solirubrobacterales bacterium]